MIQNKNCISFFRLHFIYSPLDCIESMSGKMGRLSRSKESNAPVRSSSLAEQNMSESNEVFMLIVLLRSFTKSFVLCNSSRLGPAI